MKVINNNLYSLSLRQKSRHIFSVLPLSLLAGVLFVVGAFLIKNTIKTNDDAGIQESYLETPASLFDSFFHARSRVYDTIHPGENLSLALKRLNFPKQDADKLVQALSSEINMRNIMPGSVLMAEFGGESIQLQTLTRTNNAALDLAPAALEFFAKDEHGMAFSVRASFKESSHGKDVKLSVHKAEVFKEHALINGIVSNSVYTAILDKGGDASLVNSFTDIFSWQFDFFRDTRDGDSYQMIVEKNVADGRFVGFSRVLAAEYTTGKQQLRAYYFKSKDEKISGYFDDEGRSLQNAFLKAPLKLAYITSPFNKRRFHPVQKRVKPHNGVDYGANLGTPFVAVASGLVINAGYSPFNGNWVRLKHANGYETEYLHANKLAKGIHVGARVQQGQVIGFVGKTGLASGYHLHFGMKKNSKYVDPTSQRFARSAGVPELYAKEFKSNIQAMVIALNRQYPNKANVLAQR